MRAAAAAAPKPTKPTAAAAKQAAGAAGFGLRQQKYVPQPTHPPPPYLPGAQLLPTQPPPPPNPPPLCPGAQSTPSPLGGLCCVCVCARTCVDVCLDTLCFSATQPPQQEARTVKAARAAPETLTCCCRRESLERGTENRRQLWGSISLSSSPPAASCYSLRQAAAGSHHCLGVWDHKGCGQEEQGQPYASQTDCYPSS